MLQTAVNMRYLISKKHCGLKWIAKYVVLKTYNDKLYWQLNDSFLGYTTLRFENWHVFQINPPTLVLSRFEIRVTENVLMITTVLSIVSTSIMVWRAAHPVASTVLPISPDRGVTNSNIRDKSTENNRLRNLRSSLQETSMKCREKRKFKHLAKGRLLVFRLLFRQIFSTIYCWNYHHFSVNFCQGVLLIYHLNQVRVYSNDKPHTINIIAWSGI